MLLLGHSYRDGVVRTALYTIPGYMVTGGNISSWVKTVSVAVWEIFCFALFCSGLPSSLTYHNISEAWSIFRKPLASRKLWENSTPTCRPCFLVPGHHARPGVSTDHTQHTLHVQGSQHPHGCHLAWELLKDTSHAPDSLAEPSTKSRWKRSSHGVTSAPSTALLSRQSPTESRATQFQDHCPRLSLSWDNALCLGHPYHTYVK